jgi:hypothetical protein
MIDYLWFYVPLKNFSLIWRRHHCRWRAATFRPMLSAQGLWAGRATPAVTQDLGFSGLIQRTTPFNRLLRHTTGCGEYILTQILMGPNSVAFYDKKGDAEDLFLPGSSRVHKYQSKHYRWLFLACVCFDFSKYAFGIHSINKVKKNSTH